MPPLASSAYHPGDSNDSCPGVWIDVNGHLDGLGGAERNLFSSLSEASPLSKLDPGSEWICHQLPKKANWSQVVNCEGCLPDANLGHVA